MKLNGYYLNGEYYVIDSFTLALTFARWPLYRCCPVLSEIQVTFHGLFQRLHGDLTVIQMKHLVEH